MTGSAVSSRAGARATTARPAGLPQLWISAAGPAETGGEREIDAPDYLVIMIRPQSFETLDRATVPDQIRRFLDLLGVADEFAAVTERLIALTAEVPISGKQVHDANMVATLLAYGIPTLVTHNTRDFVRFGKHIRFESIE